MHILVTNDDGVQAPGLLALTQAMRQVADKVTVLAPDHNWSASGHVKTLHRPLRVIETRLDDGSTAWASDGAPSDCVALAQLGFIPEKIDLVVSGINPNSNIGHDVTYSGTVTAAMEAAIWGIPGIAVSLNRPEKPTSEVDYTHAAEAARRVISWLMAQADIPKDLILNINVPYGPLAEMKGFRMTRQACGFTMMNWCDGWTRAAILITGLAGTRPLAWMNPVRITAHWRMVLSQLHRFSLI